MTDNVTVTKVINQVQIASDGPQGPTGPSGVISVTAPITNSGTSTSAVIGINAGVAGGVATLDGTGKVPQNQLPAVAITNTFVVASQAAMLALTAEEGDVAVRTDLNKSFILSATPSSTLANWQELLTPTDSVLSVDGLTGAVDLTTKYAQLATANTFTTSPQQINGAASAVGLIVKANATTPGDLQQWQSSAGTVLARITNNGVVSTGAVYSQYFQPRSGTGVYIDVESVSSTVSVIQRTTTAVGLIVKGAASQTADYFQIQNSAGTVRAYISAGAVIGTAVGFANLANTGTYLDTSTNTMTFIQRVAATPVLAVRGAASQTANLQEWQNSGGTVLASITSGGAISATQGITVTGSSINGSNGHTNSIGPAIVPVNFAVTAGSATIIPIVNRGAASQTADLQQWQNSAGTILANIASNGTLSMLSIVGQSGNNLSITSRPASGIFYLDSGSNGAAGSFVFRTSSSYTTVLTITGAGRFNIVAGNTATTVGAAGAASALPATPTGYIIMQVAGTDVKVPYYDN